MNEHMKSTHPIRLGLALNFSVFYYEVMNDYTKASQLAKSALDDITTEIGDNDEDLQKESALIMQLIKENLTLWSSEMMSDDGNG